MLTKPYLYFFLLFSCLSCNLNKKEPVLEIESNSEIPVYNFEELEPLLYTDSSKTYLINFWAMWCVPCVKELPFIEAYAEAHPEVEVLLVSMDFPKDIETKLKPFLKSKHITSKVVILDDPDANTWIDKVSPNWSGAIPFTIIFNKDKRAYFEHSFPSLEAIEQTVTETLIQ
ncbi:TlpA family protein disulfide reductase [Bizionia sp. KMM 8389]